jgi:hypothetical protein
VPKWQHSRVFRVAKIRFHKFAWLSRRSFYAAQAAGKGLPVETAPSGCLSGWPGGIFRVGRLLWRVAVKPRRDFLRRNGPSRQVRIDGAGGDGQSAIEFGAGKIPCLGFGFKCSGQAWVTSWYQGATSGHFIGDVPNMRHRRSRGRCPDPDRSQETLPRLRRSGARSNHCRCIRRLFARRRLDLNQGRDQRPRVARHDRIDVGN